MKLIVAYDGSPMADAAIDDLALAGLPDTGEAVVLSVAEVWLPPENLKSEDSLNPYIEGIVEEHRKRARGAVSAAQHLADRGGQQVLSHLPGWKVTAEGTYGSPAWSILDRAEQLAADLIVVGSHSRSAIGRLFLGSVSQKVLTEASCSVRVCRGKIGVDHEPSSIIIAFDGSQGAQAAVAAVESRKWRPGTKVSIVGVVNPVAATVAGQLVPPVVEWVEEENEALVGLLKGLAGEAADRLKVRGIDASVSIISGEPKSTLLEEAQNTHADCVFVGANRYGSRIERFLLGSVSSAVAARAHCSVEVVRNTSLAGNHPTGSLEGDTLVRN